VWVRVGFWEASWRTTSPEDFFLNNNFFLDIKSLFIDDMGNNVVANANANANLQAAPYVVLSSLFQILLEFLVLAIGRVFSISCSDVIFQSILLYYLP
jgi:hypothetical protein